MKRIFLAILVYFISVAAHAQMKNDYNLLGFDFVAPAVYDIADAPKQVGSIVYDSQNNTFSGYTADGQWVILSNSDEVNFENKATSASYGGVAGQWYDLASINLPPGLWQINAQLLYSNSSTNQEVRVGISTVSGNSDSGLSEGDNLMKAYFDSSASAYVPVYINSYIVNVTTLTTHYLKARVGSNVSGMSVAYKINGVRIR